MTPEEERKQEVLDEIQREEEVDNAVEAMQKSFENQPVGLDQVRTATRLLDKNYSPLIVRKYQMHGWPLFIALICDVSLSDLDNLVHGFTKAYGSKEDDIQWVRNYCGALSQHLVDTYEAVKPGCVEGVAVLWYVDKMFVSSLFGDFMVHSSCKMELFSIIQTLPHI
jgi:hypothetical protein